MIRILCSLILILFVSQIAFAQTAKSKPVSTSLSNQVKNSPAYAELLLQQVELKAELEDLLVAYTEEFPKVKELRHRLELTNKTLEKILKVDAAESAKLTLALGKLLVKKTELETDLWKLRKQYNEEHPEVKRFKRKVEVYEEAVKEILP